MDTNRAHERETGIREQLLQNNPPVAVGGKPLFRLLDRNGPAKVCRGVEREGDCNDSTSYECSVPYIPKPCQGRSGFGGKFCNRTNQGNQHGRQDYGFRVRTGWDRSDGTVPGRRKGGSQNPQHTVRVLTSIVCGKSGLGCPDFPRASRRLVPPAGHEAPRELPTSRYDCD